MAFSYLDPLKLAGEVLKEAKGQLAEAEGRKNMFDGLNAIAAGLSTEGLDTANAMLVKGFQIMPKEAEERRAKNIERKEEEVAEAQKDYNKELDEQRKRRAEMFKRRMEYFAGDMESFEELLLSGESKMEKIAGGLNTPIGTPPPATGK